MPVIFRSSEPDWLVPWSGSQQDSATGKLWPAGPQCRQSQLSPCLTNVSMLQSCFKQGGDQWFSMRDNSLLQWDFMDLVMGDLDKNWDCLHIDLSVWSDIVSSFPCYQWVCKIYGVLEILFISYTDQNMSIAGQEELCSIHDTRES